MLLGCLKIGEKRNGDLMNTWLLNYPEHLQHGQMWESGHKLHMVRRGRQTIYYATLHMVRRGRQTIYYATLSILILLLLNLRWAYSRVTSNSFTF